MINKINYPNKQAFQNNDEIPENQKVTDLNMNEIKEVINDNADELSNLQEKVDVGLKAAFTYKGSVSTYSDLAELQATNGDIYTVTDENKNYVYNGNEWIEYNSNFNVTQLDEIEEKLDNLPIKTYIKHIATTEVISANTNYEIPKYTLGNNSLAIFYEGCKLIKDDNYIEVDETHIQFKDWDVPDGSNLEIVIKEANNE